MVSLPWIERAKCREADSQVFFPYTETQAQVQKCREICEGCPVFDDCLGWVLDNFDLIPEGIFAGYSADERAGFDTMVLPFYDWRDDEARQEHERRYYADPLEERQRQSEERKQARVSRRNQRRRALAVQRKQEKLSARPACPRGHGPENVYKYRRNRQGAQVWDCYLCHSKMITEVVGAREEAS